MTEAEAKEAIANYKCHFDISNRLLRKMCNQIGWDVDRLILQEIIDHLKPYNEVE